MLRLEIEEAMAHSASGVVNPRLTPNGRFAPPRQLRLPGFEVAGFHPRREHAAALSVGLRAAVLGPRQGKVRNWG